MVTVFYLCISCSILSPSLIAASHGFCQELARGKRARRRPLHTCGMSCVSIGRKACKKAQDLDGPLGSMARTSITRFNFIFPFINSMVHQCLNIALIIDDQILFMESKIERIVPRSAYLFDRVDKLVCGVEALPHQLENMVKRLPSLIHQFPLLDWMVVHLIWFLNILLWILVHLGSKNGREKEIGMNAVEHTKTVQFEKPYSYADAARNHTESDPQTTKGVPTEVIHLSVKRLHSWKTRIKALEEPLSAGDSPMYSSYQSANSSPVSDGSQDDSHRFTYKEILERDKKEGDDAEEEAEEERKCFIANELVK